MQCSPCITFSEQVCMIVRFYLSFYIKISLKMHFWCENITDLSLCGQRCYGCHKITVLTFNHLWLTNFNTW